MSEPQRGEAGIPRSYSDNRGDIAKKSCKVVPQNPKTDPSGAGVILGDRPSRMPIEESGRCLRPVQRNAFPDDRAPTPGTARSRRQPGFSVGSLLNLAGEGIDWRISQGRDRAAGVAPVARRERAAENAWWPTCARPADPARDRVKKCMVRRLTAGGIEVDVGLSFPSTASPAGVMRSNTRCFKRSR